MNPAQTRQEHGTRSERLEELLRDVPPLDRLKLFDVKDALPFTGMKSIAGVYRLHAEGRLPAIKLEGKFRAGGRGRAGSLRFRLRDLIEFQVARESAS